MKKSMAALAIACAMLLAPVYFPAQTTHAAAANAVYLGGRISRGAQGDCVWQSYSSIASGESAARFGYESGGENKFLRMANFDGTADSLRTSAVFSCAGELGEATVSFSYRFSEGETAYRDASPVFTAELRGARHTLTYGDLTPSVAEDLTWQTVSFTMADFTEEAGNLTLVFHYSVKGGESVFADLDDVTVRAGGKTAAECDFEFAAVGSSDEKVYESLGRGDGSLMLSGADIADYEENTELENVLRADFNDLRSAPLARQGSSGTFHTAASAAAGGSDIYAVCDSIGNGFLRLANVNGTIQETQFTTYFYDNGTGAQGNMPVTDCIYFSFRYRLYIDGYIRAGMRGDEVILGISTRSSGVNHAGEISLDELVLNEAGDDTWHTFRSVLDVQRSSTAYMIVTYYSYADTSYSNSTFLDLDDLTLSPSVNGANYAHLGGTFDGLAEDGEESSVYFREELGVPAEKRAKNSLDGEMLLPAGGTFSLRADMPRRSNVFYAAFDLAAQEGDTLAIRLGGRCGDLLPLTVGSPSAELSVNWEKRGETWRCRLFYARACYGGISSWDFVNTGTREIAIDNFLAGQVLSVSAEAGDFAAFSARLSAIKSEIDSGAFTTDARLSLARLVYTANQITENSSEARMDAALSALEAALSSAARRADLTELLGAIAEAEKKLAENDPDSFGKRERLLFYDALAAARSMSADDGQAAVDGAAKALREATAALEATAAKESSDSPVAVAVGAGGAVLGCSLAGVCLVKRRFL